MRRVAKRAPNSNQRTMRGRGPMDTKTRRVNRSLRRLRKSWRAWREVMGGGKGKEWG